MSKQYKNLLTVFGTLIIISVISVVSAAFNTEMQINGNAVLRVDADIRITGLKVKEDSIISGAYETYSSKYNKDSTSMFVTLPNIDSTLIYEVTLTNKSTKNYDITNIVIENHSNSNIKYEIVGIEKGTEIAGNTTQTFTIKLSYNTTTLPSNIKEELIIKYEFEEHIYPYVVETYDYSGKEENFIVPHDGLYKLEVWGAQGGSTGGNDTYGIYQDYFGGNGGYSSGLIALNKNQELYIVVGGQGTGGCVVEYCIGGYNGGGNSGVSTEDTKNYTCSGGGATHIAKTNRGLLSNYASYQSEVLIVAGGGGGGYYHEFGELHSNFGGAGGGANGIDGTLSGYKINDVIVANATGGTQTSGGIKGYRGANGSFGQGGSGSSCNTTDCGSSGGGGGWYGGGASGHSGTGGGSGYIGTLTDGSTIDGTQSIPTHDGSTVMTGNSGNGYAKITFLKRIYN